MEFALAGMSIWRNAQRSNAESQLVSLPLTLLRDDSGGHTGWERMLFDRIEACIG